MPIKKVKLDGKTGYKYGNSGHVYPTKEGALKQMRAMFANGYQPAVHNSPKHGHKK